MPYFIRQPYAASRRQVETGEAPDILMLAAGVLASETSLPGTSPFRVRSPVRPGTSGSLVLGFTAEQAPVAFRLSVTDLTGTNGIIPSHCLKVHPPVLALDIGDTTDVTVHFSIPEHIVPGLYEGRITAANGNGFSAPIEVVVTL